MLQNRFEAANTRVLVAVPPKNRSDNGAVHNQVIDADAVEIPWNKRSPISAKAIVTTAHNRFGQSFETILVCDVASAGAVTGVRAAGDGTRLPATGVRVPASGARIPGAVDVERRIDDELKAALYVSREVTQRRIVNEPARLSFVLNEGFAPLSPISRLVLRGLEGFVESLFESNDVIRGFRCLDDDVDGFVEAVVDEVTSDGRRSRGKWLVHGKRSVLGLFSGR